jgi:hypothetical protein
MTEQQARRLRPGDRVRWYGENGTVTRVHKAGEERGISSDGVTIRWDDGLSAIRYLNELDTTERA